MLHFRTGIAVVLLCAFTTASFAQSAAPVHASHNHKVHTKKVPKPDDSSVENWDIAVPTSSPKTDLGGNESEGRKKFFEQSTTMDNGGPAGSSGGKSSGFTPSMGLSF